MKPGRVLTGIRATGEIHLGNYLGAIQPALQLATQHKESFYFIADLHGLTTNPRAEEMAQNIRAGAAAWLACGLDPEKSVFWRQSAVQEVSELFFTLSCVTSFGLLERAHTYKDLQAKNAQIKAGIVMYPVLMAADILLFNADYVPVGKDQAQHLEMSRDIATFFNETYSNVFTLPQALINEAVAVIPGTDGRKMSKSYNNGINLFAPEGALKKQVMGIVTDSKGLEESKDPESCIVYKIFRLVESKPAAEEMAQKLKAGGYGYGDAKKKLLSALLDGFSAQRQNYDRIVKDPAELNSILSRGAERARVEARKMIARVKESVGL